MFYSYGGEYLVELVERKGNNCIIKGGKREREYVCRIVLNSVKRKEGRGNRLG